MLVDVHCHIDDRAFEADREQVVERARNVLILNAGIDPASNRKTIEIAGKYANVKACLGLHPEFIAKFTDNLIASEIEWIGDHRKNIVAVSEIGLDYYWVKDENQRNRQRNMFRRMLELAEELGLPAIIHSREATNDTLTIIREFPELKIILHGFSELDNKGYLVSVAPNVYRNKAKQRQVKQLPLETLLTETDSPLLGIDPKERNEPANVVKVIDKIAELKNLSADTVRTSITRTASSFFGDQVFQQFADSSAQ